MGFWLYWNQEVSYAESYTENWWWVLGNWNPVGWRPQQTDAWGNSEGRQEDKALSEQTRRRFFAACCWNTRFRTLALQKQRSSDECANRADRSGARKNFASGPHWTDTVRWYRCLKFTWPIRRESSGRNWRPIMALQSASKQSRNLCIYLAKTLVIKASTQNHIGGQVFIFSVLLIMSGKDLLWGFLLFSAHDSYPR